MLQTRDMEMRTEGAMSLVTIAVIAIVIISVVGVTLFALSSQQPPGSSVAENGDTVKINYIGMFENGRVFDTSMADVAFDNATYPKAVSFAARDILDYNPLEFTVGGGQMIAGFDEPVRGMKVGDTKTVTVPPSKGYGDSSPLLIHVRNLMEEMPCKETLNRTGFSERFFVDPVENSIVLDPKWGWNVTVFDITGDFVTVLHQPELGMLITPHKSWDSKVIFIDSAANQGAGLIKVQNLLLESAVDNVKATDEDGEFRVVAVDLENGTYTVDYNREVVGKNLTFYMVLVELKKAPATAQPGA